MGRNFENRKQAIFKRGAANNKAFTRATRQVTMAVKAGGGDPETNPTLRRAIQNANAVNMPKDRVTSAIEKALGLNDTDNYEEAIYEGFGPGGAAMIVTALTDNKTRTVADVRSFFKKGGGTLGQPGSVAFSFQTKGQFIIEAADTTEEQLMDVTIDAGAEDVEAPDGDDGVWTVLCEPADFSTVRDAIEGANIKISSAEITKIATNTIEVAGDDVRKLMNLIEALEDSDDVQKVYSNADISDEALAALE